jgi:hypothetical protein
MRRLLLLVVVIALYALHQDVWFWRAARPLVFGFLPVGLAYHAAYCVAVALLMWVFTRVAWPSHLESAAAEVTPDRPAFARTSATSPRNRVREGGRG